MYCKPQPLYDSLLPPNMQVILLEHFGNASVVGLKANHQSTAVPSPRSGAGEELCPVLKASNSPESPAESGPKAMNASEAVHKLMPKTTLALGRTLSLAASMGFSMSKDFIA